MVGLGRLDPSVPARSSMPAFLCVVVTLAALNLLLYNVSIEVNVSVGDHRPGYEAGRGPLKISDRQEKSRANNIKESNHALDDKHGVKPGRLKQQRTSRIKDRSVVASKLQNTDQADDIVSSKKDNVVIKSEQDTANHESIDIKIPVNEEQDASNSFKDQDASNSFKEPDVSNTFKAQDASAEEPRANEDQSLAVEDLVYAPITCDKCFKREYAVLVSPSPVCDNKKASPDIIAVVLSTAQSPEERSVFRETWLKYARGNQSPQFRYVFLLGSSPRRAVQRAVGKEAARHKDILQQSFIESYDNLTMKTMMGIDYAVSECPKARYVLKVDTDVFVNMPKMITFLGKWPAMTKLLGHCKYKNQPLRTRPHGKWYIPKEMYEQEIYPPYCEGPRYLIPMPAAREISRLSPNVPFFKMEDVYIGMVVALTDFEIQMSAGFYTPMKLNNITSPDQMDCSRMQRVFTTHRTSAEHIRMLWDTCFDNPQLSLPRLG